MIYFASSDLLGEAANAPVDSSERWAVERELRDASNEHKKLSFEVAGQAKVK